VKEVRVLEESMFELVQTLYESIQLKNLENYRLGLAVLDELNEEYCDITGQYYISPMKTLEYHSNQWSKFC
jgi:hypothetical protein